MKEIIVTNWRGLITSIKNIPRGQSVITKEVDDNGLLVRRWYFDGTSEVVLEPNIEEESS